MDAARAPDGLMSPDPVAAVDAGTAPDDPAGKTADEPMATREVALPDGRYLVFYTFGDPAPEIG